MSDPLSILLVEDEAAIREMLIFNLQSAGFQCFQAADTKQAWASLTVERPDLILLDWMLPNESGVSLIARLKAHASLQSIPIIMLTARAEEANKVHGLEAGVDDYVVKPFSPRELIARIRAVLRRAGVAREQTLITIKDLRLDPSMQQVTIRDQVIKLSPGEYKLLHFFMTHPNRVFTRDQLLNEVWGHDVYVTERSVDTKIRRLRSALEKDGYGALIKTIRNSGYLFLTKDTINEPQTT